MLENEDYNKFNNNLYNKTNIIRILSKSKSPNLDELNQNKNENKWEKLLIIFFTTINSIDNSIEKIRSKLNNLKNF